MSQPRVAVIGGGLAGLAAACRLRALHVEPLVFESDHQVGGMLRTTAHDGWIIDAGPPMAAEPDPAVRAMLDNVGAGAFTVRAGPAGPVRYIVYDGAPVPLPRTTTEFNASPLLSLAGRLRLLKERFVPAARVAEESVDHFARRRFGDEMADRMFDPQLASMCAGDPREILARYAFPAQVGHEQRGGSGLQASARDRMQARRRTRTTPAGSWSCAAGMQQLPLHLAWTVGGVRTGMPVRAVRKDGEHFRINGDGFDTVEVDGVIFAIPAPAFARITVDVEEPHRLDQVATMPHESIASVSLGFRQDQVGRPLAAARLLVPTIERRAILSVAFPSVVFAGRAPEDHLLITGYIGGARYPTVDRDDPATLVGVMVSELRDLLDIAGDPVLAEFTLWPAALAQAVAGHSQRLAAAEAVESGTPGVAFAGAWRDGLSVSEVMLGAVRAAERLTSRRGWVERAPWH